jgi:hypothetical protein
VQDIKCVLEIVYTIPPGTFPYFLFKQLIT